MIPLADISTVNSVSHLIQLSVAPVFLLAAVAGLLNVFVGRLVRIIDKIEKIDSADIQELTSEARSTQTERKLFLKKRLRITNYAIALCTMSGLMVAFVIITLFLTSLFNFGDSIFIATFFMLAMVFLISSLILFLREIFYTDHFIRALSKNR